MSSSWTSGSQPRRGSRKCRDGNQSIKVKENAGMTVTQSREKKVQGWQSINQGRRKCRDDSKGGHKIVNSLTVTLNS
jgi:hypothetical protein